MPESFTEWLGGGALRDLRRLWRDLVPAALQGADRPVHPDLPEGDLSRIRRQIGECLEALGGEVSARMRAAGLGETYLGLTPIGRERFLRLLAAEYGVDRGAVHASINRYLSADDDDLPGTEQQLRASLQSPRRRLMTQFNALPSGVKFLVDLRSDLLSLKPLDRDLRSLDQDLMEILRSWFDVGLLELRRISWDSPASLLEKLIAYEAVHEIESWNDLRNRLEFDRRCYAYFHPSMPEEPLIFVEVALVERLAGNIQALLDEKAPELDPARASTAIFYSISNTQAGLRGISFGSFLIKRVVEDLSHTFPRLKQFATLSPIPGFRRWLQEAGSELAESAQIEALLNQPAWVYQPETARRLEPILMRLCGRYLVEVKRGNRPIDAVARFHLGNGAVIEQLNWLADTSANGVKQSAGIMVNYGYRNDEIEKNHEAYHRNGEIRMSPAVERLLRKSRGRRSAENAAHMPGGCQEKA